MMGLGHGFILLAAWVTFVTVSPYPADFTDNLFYNDGFSTSEPSYNFDLSTSEPSYNDDFGTFEPSYNGDLSMFEPSYKDDFITSEPSYDDHLSTPEASYNDNLSSSEPSGDAGDWLMSMDGSDDSSTTLAWSDMEPVDNKMMDGDQVSSYDEGGVNSSAGSHELVDGAFASNDDSVATNPAGCNTHPSRRQAQSDMTLGTLTCISRMLYLG